MADDLVEAIRDVLAKAARGKGTDPQFLTSYQVLNRLPRDLRDELIRTRGLPGKGTKRQHTAVGVVATTLESIVGADVEKAYFDSKGAWFDVGDECVRAGFGLCALYRKKLHALEEEDDEERAMT